jgi:hypothetical protein
VCDPSVKLISLFMKVQKPLASYNSQPIRIRLLARLLYFLQIGNPNAVRFPIAIIFRDGGYTATGISDRQCSRRILRDGGIRTLLYLAVIAFISACDTRSRDLLGSTMNLTTWVGSNT